MLGSERGKGVSNPGRGRRRAWWASPSPWVLLIAALTFPVSCQPAAPPLPSSLRIGYAVEPPYAFQEGSRITGESPEILRVVASELGIEQLRWVPMDFGQLMPSLEAGRVDVIAAGLFITPERSVRVRFTRPTFCAAMHLVFPETLGGEVVGLDLPALLADPDLRFAVLEEGVEDHHLRQMAPRQGQVVPVPDLLTALAGLRSDRVDGLFISGPTARWIVAEDPDGPLDHGGPFWPIPPAAPKTRSCGGLAFRHADGAMADAADEVLATFLGSPPHREMMHRFGFTQEELEAAADFPAVPAPARGEDR